MKKLLLLAYLDDSPGHRKQSLALADALAMLTPTELVTVELCKRRGKTLSSELRHSADLLIGTGRKTHLPLLADKLGSFARARAVCCMLPSLLLRPFFDLCFVPAHDQPRQGANIFTTLGPPCRVYAKGGHRPDSSLVLVGGVDNKSHYWRDELICEMVATLIGEDERRSWVVSSSPRTPGKTVSLLADLAAKSQRVNFFRAEDTPPGWLDEQYQIHRDVWVSADSVSMLYEALSAGCRVGVLPVEWKKKDNKFQRGIDQLKQSGLVRDYQQWLYSKTDWSPAANGLFEAERCAKEILSRWWS